MMNSRQVKLLLSSFTQKISYSLAPVISASDCVNSPKHIWVGDVMAMLCEIVLAFTLKDLIRS